MVAPGPVGAHNWYPMSFSEHTKLVYIPALEASSYYKHDDKFQFRDRTWNTGVSMFRGEANAQTVEAASEEQGRSVPARVGSGRPARGLARVVRARAATAACCRRAATSYSRAPSTAISMRTPPTRASGCGRRTSRTRSWAGRSLTSSTASSTSPRWRASAALRWAAPSAAQAAAQRVRARRRVQARRQGFSCRRSRHRRRVRRRDSVAREADGDRRSSASVTMIASARLATARARRSMTSVPDLRYSEAIVDRTAFKAIVLDGARADKGMVGFGAMLSETGRGSDSRVSRVAVCRAGVGGIALTRPASGSDLGCRL